MSGTTFRVTVPSDYAPEDGDAFDAVVAALDFFEVPSVVEALNDRRGPDEDAELRVTVPADWIPPTSESVADSDPETAFSAVVSALEHFYIPASIVEAPAAAPAPASGHPRSTMGGFMLLEFLLVLGLASLAMVFLLDKQLRDLEISRASMLGQELATYNAGVQARMVAEPSLTPGPYTGIAWLKSAACGGTAPEDYVPCNLPAETTFGRLTYATTVAASGSDLMATTVMPPLQIGGANRSDLSGYVALDALKRSTDDGVYYSYNSDPATAVITMTASTAPTTAPEYLRTDGGNTMNADITFNNAFADRDINNARNIYTENVAASGSVSANGNVAAAGSVSGSYVQSTGNSYTAGQHRADHSLFTNGYVQAMTDGHIGQNAYVGWSAAIGQNVTAQGFMGARDYWIEDIGRWASKGAYEVFLSDSEVPVNKVPCPAGLQSRIYWMPSGTVAAGPSTGWVAEPIYAIWPQAHDWGTQWYLRTYALTNTGWHILPGAHGRGVVIMKCI